MHSKLFSSFKLRTILMVVAGISLCQAANAEPGQPAADSFRHNATNTPNHLPASARVNDGGPMIGAGAGQMMSGNSPIVLWFEKLDKDVGSNLPTPFEKVTLTQPLNQQLERVEAMTKVYTDISKRYRRLAKSIRAMPVQANWPGVEEYKESRAAFFDDEAQVFEDLVRPRRPAETIEELRAQLTEVQEHAHGLKDEGRQLTAMDRDLRQTYKIHAPRYDDALAKYVMQKKGPQER